MAVLFFFVLFCFVLFFFNKYLKNGKLSMVNKKT